MDMLWKFQTASPPETYHGQRVQKFVYKGLSLVTAKDQGAVWPKR